MVMSIGIEKTMDEIQHLLIIKSSPETEQWSQQIPSSNNKREYSTQGHHQMVNTQIRLIIFFSAKDGEALYSKQRLGVDCGSDHELLIAKFRLKLKKVGKTTRPFRYDLNQIPYAVEVTNRFKGLDLIDRVPEKLWTEVCDTVQEAAIKTIPKGKKMQKAKQLSEEALQIAEKRREAKSKGETECRVPQNSKKR